MSGPHHECLLDKGRMMNETRRIMKSMHALALVGIALSPLAFGELQIPRTVFQMSELDQAKQKAAEDKKPLIFVITDPGTS